MQKQELMWNEHLQMTTATKLRIVSSVFDKLPINVAP